jgi:hypothetical protein
VTRVTWKVSTDRLPRLVEILAGISGCPFDDWDRDALRYGLPSTNAAAGAYFYYVLCGPTPISLRLAHAAGGRVAVTATADAGTEARLARIELNSDAEAWEQLCRVFGAVPRPERFINHPGCPECEGHDRLLCARDWETLSHYDVRYTWSPVGFLKADGFRYWLPALLRLSFTEDEDGYAGDLRDYLDDPRDARFSLLTAEERRAVARYLRHVAWWQPERVGDERDRRELEEKVGAWDASAEG